MKIAKYLFAFAALALAVAGCDKDTSEDAFSTAPVAPSLDAHAAIVITQSTMEEGVVFSWKAARFVGGELTYSFRAVYGETDAELTTTPALNCSWTKKDFLALLDTKFAALPVREDYTMSFYVTAANGTTTLSSEKIDVAMFANAEDSVPVLSAPKAEVALDAAKASAAVELLTWAAASVGANEKITYAVEYRTSDEQPWNVFADGIEALAFSMSAKELNDKLTADPFNIEAGGSISLEFRVVAYSDTAAAGLASNAVKVKVTTYVPISQVGAWSLIGNVAGDTTWSVDSFLSPMENGLWISDVVSITGDFKLRFNCSWNVTDRGGSLVELGVPFDVKKGGDNISVPEAGDYFVVYNEATEQVTIYPHSAPGWGLIGGALANGWDKDTYKLMEVAPGVFKTAVCHVADGDFKFRKDGAWGTEYTGTFVEFDKPFAAGAGSGNIKLTEADVDVVMTLDTNNGTVTVAKNRFAGAWGVIGQVNGHSWDKDVFMWSDGKVWTSAPFSYDGGFKIRMDAAWTVDRGGQFSALGEPFAVTQGGSNIELGAENLGKFFRLVYDPAAETITVTEVK